MHLKNPLLFGLIAIVLLTGTITPVLGQSTPDVRILINEVELNPEGSDAGLGITSKTTEGVSGSQEYVELYNPTSQTIDISGWSIVPTATWKSFEIPNNTIIEPNSFLVFTHVNFWFKDFAESITLIDDVGNVIDETPILKDQDDEQTSWQRKTDGFNTNSLSDWELKLRTPKSSNGKIVEVQESNFSLTASFDKSQFVFGDTATLTGNLSEKLFTVNSTPEIVKINIKGQNYFKNIGLFPDRDLNFSTTLNLQKVLGFNEGSYTVEISYGENTITTNFAIVDESESATIEANIETLEMFTDKQSYIPGEFVLLSADTNSTIEYGGLDYIVTNPNGKIVFQGTIFPNEKFSTVFKKGAGQIYPFSTTLFMSAVNPVYGTYEVDGLYKSQNPRYHSSENILVAKTSFVFAEDIKEDIPISISTDKEVYSVGDIIKVSGRSNQVWVEDLELKVVQTGIMNPATHGSDARYVAPDPFTLKDRVRLNGDGTFEFEFKLIETLGDTNYSKWYGDYVVSVSEYFGEASASFNVVENPDTFVDVRTPLGLTSTNSEYVLGSELVLTGKIVDYDFKVDDNIRNTVEITFSDSNGKIISFQDHKNVGLQKSNCNTNDCAKYDIPLKYTAMPDLVGVFKISTVLNPIQFAYGTYVATAVHPLSGLTESVQFEIKSAQSEIIPETSTQEPLVFELCKSDRAHVDEVLKDLRSIGKGENAPSLESIDCTPNQIFNIGDKLIVTGKVIPRAVTTLDQSSTKTSAQTQQGHSYSTNFADSTRNYVMVSIPYPTSMTIKGTSSVQTVPDEGEDYHGGGGSGEGGTYYKDADGNVIRGDSSKSTTRGDESKSTGYNGKVVLNEQKLLLTNMNYKAYPDDEGNFATVFELRAGVFKQGTYAVKADYFGYHEEDTVTIIDSSLKGGMEPTINVTLDKDEFVSGETVRISGAIENIYYFDSVSVKIETPDVSKINCFQGQQCGFGNTEKKLRVQEGVDGAKFYWNYNIPKTPGSVGTYTIVVDTHFGVFEKQFFVVDESEIIGQVSPPGTEIPESTLNSQKIIEKFNRISDNEIPITLGEKSSDDSTLAPRVLQGSLFTSARGEESDVNLRITTSEGQCVIGQDSDCLVSESTRKPGAIYSVVSIDDINYKIRYSGNDVRLEKFSIVPEQSGSKIDVDNWNVEIMKDEQPSRFYYKVSYVALE